MYAYELHSSGSACPAGRSTAGRLAPSRARSPPARRSGRVRWHARRCRPRGIELDVIIALGEARDQQPARVAEARPSSERVDRHPRPPRAVIVVGVVVHVSVGVRAPLAEVAREQSQRRPAHHEAVAAQAFAPRRVAANEQLVVAVHARRRLVVVEPADRVLRRVVVLGADPDPRAHLAVGARHRGRVEARECELGWRVLPAAEPPTDAQPAVAEALERRERVRLDRQQAVDVAQDVAARRRDVLALADRAP